MIDLFNCVAPSRADASTLLDFDNLYDRQLCSSTVLVLKALMVNFSRVATLAFDLAFRLALLLVPVWVIVTGVQAFLSWAERYREKVEMLEEESTEEQSELGPDAWNFPRTEEEDEQSDDSVSAASHQANRSLSPTPVPEISVENLQELNRQDAKLNERRDGFEQVYPDIGPQIYDQPQYQAYRQERAVLIKAFREIRRAQSPQSDTLPGRLRREGAVTRSAFLYGDTRPREECFDSDEETACEDG